MRNWYYRVLYQWILRRCVFATGVQIKAPLIINGPGKVIWGKGSTIEPGLHTKKGVTIVTYDANATVMIGDGAILRGTSIGCVQKITIGSHCLLDGAHLIDADLHPTDPRARYDSHSPGTGDPIVIGYGVYVGPHTILMKGVTLGDHVQVMVGSSLGKKYIGDQAIIRGCPATFRKKATDHNARLA